jgi:hypothetical protein
MGFGASSAHADSPTAAAPPSSAAAQIRPLAGDEPPLKWTVPEGCPTRPVVLEGLAQLLDVDRTSWDRFETVQGRISRREEAFELELEFTLGQRVEQRTFRTRDCADLAHAAAVTLALVLDPAWDWEAEAAPATDAARPGAAPSKVDSGPGEVVSAPASNAEVGFEIGPEGVIDTSTLGRSAFGLGLIARARATLFGTRSSAELFAAWLPGQRIDVRPTESVTLGLASAGLRACNWPTVGLGLCAEIEAGRLSARGVGESAGREAFDAWVAPGGSIVFESRLIPGLLLDSRIGLLAPLARPRYFVNYSEGVHDVPAVTVRVALGLILTRK